MWGTCHWEQGNRSSSGQTSLLRTVVKRGPGRSSGRGVCLSFQDPPGPGRSRNRARASPDDAALVPLVLLHVEVAAVGNGKDVGRQLAHVVAVVELYLLQGVQGQHLEWVHSYQDGACVGLGKGVGRWLAPADPGREFLAPSSGIIG